MTFLKSSLKHIAFSVLSVLGGITLGATLVGAVTTISTAISTAGDITTTEGNLLVTAGTLTVGGDTTLASTTATGLKVGQTGTRHTGILSGYCTIAATNITATTTAQATCSGATGVTTSYKVFVQATSSLPGMIVVQAATSSTDAIEVIFFNTGLGTTTAGGIGPLSLNFWAVL